MSILTRIRLTLRALFFRRRVETELDDEMRFHVEEEYESGLAAGLTPDEARRAAMESLGGGVVQVKEACRDRSGVSFIEEFVQDTRLALRGYRKSPGFAAVTLLTLAGGIGVSVAIFSIVDAWLLRPLSFPDARRIVIGLGGDPKRPAEPSVFMLNRGYLAFSERSRSFDGIEGVFWRGFLITGGRDPEEVRGMMVTPGLFNLLGVRPLIGRTFTAQDANGTPVTVLGYGLWMRRFGGSRDAVGKRIVMNGAPHEVIGVMPREFDLRILDQPKSSEAFIPIPRGEPNYGPGQTGPLAVIAKVRRDVSMAAAQAELDAIHQETESAFRDGAKQYRVLLTLLQADNTRSIRATLFTLAGGAVCLLLIAFVNVGALLLGRALVRRHEIAIRAAIGSGRRRLIRQLLNESIVLAVIGCLGGLVVAQTATGLFVAWVPLGSLPPHDVGVNARALAFACGLTALTTLLCGLVPALQGSRVDLNDVLKAAGSRTSLDTRSRRLQTTLLVGQLAGTVVLLVCTSLMLKTFLRLTTEPLGFQASRLSVLTAFLPSDKFDSGARTRFRDALIAKLRSLPGITSVAAGSQPPMHSGGNVTVWLEREPPGESQPRLYSHQRVTQGYFETLSIPVVAGEPFSAHHRDSREPVAILNELAARSLFGSPEAALNRRVWTGRNLLRRVIGVAGNTRSVFYNSLEWQTHPIVYTPAETDAATGGPPTRPESFFYFVRSERPLDAATVKAAIESVSANAGIISFRPAREYMSEAVLQPKFRTITIAAFGLAGLLLAAIGIYASASQAVVRRWREIGIRQALGASPSSILRFLLRDALLTAAAGLACGAALAVGLTGALSSLLYGVKPLDPLSFAAAGGALIAAVSIAAVIPAAQALNVGVSTILRAE